MQGLMQDHPLTLPHFFDRAEQLFPDKAVVTATAAGPRDARPTASGPSAPGGSAACSTTSASRADGRVATFGWNTARHLELYFAAPCTGRVLHTLNIRLFPEQLTYIVNHAEDEVIFVDRSLTALLVAAAATRSRPCATSWSWTTAPASVPTRLRAGRAVHDYEDAAGRRRPGRVRRRRTRTRPRRCATRAAPRATRRASSTATARRSCTPWAS